MAEESDEDKTELPTPHRLEKAREEGQIPRSRELTSVLMLLAGLMILWLGGSLMARRFAAQAWTELFKGILKAVLVGSVGGWYIWSHSPEMLRLIS
nr:Flagellar biosynthetic protein FlhB [Candidatus Pantoea persica]